MWVSCKPRNYRHYHLLVANTGKMHWTEYASLHDICQLHKSLQNCEQRSAMEHPMETRVPWPLRQTCICTAYRNESISQFKRRNLRTIWHWEWSETGLCSCPETVLNFLFIVLYTAFPNSTQRVKIQSRSGTNVFNASQFKSIRKTRNVCRQHYLSCTQPSRCTENNHSFLKICKHIWAEI